MCGVYKIFHFGGKESDEGDGLVKNLGERPGILATIMMKNLDSGDRQSLIPIPALS